MMSISSCPGALLVGGVGGPARRQLLTFSLRAPCGGVISYRSAAQLLGPLWRFVQMMEIY